jgi:hypothetical protein
MTGGPAGAMTGGLTGVITGAMTGADTGTGCVDSLQVVPIQYRRTPGATGSGYQPAGTLM